MFLTRSKQTHTCMGRRGHASLSPRGGPFPQESPAYFRSDGLSDDVFKITASKFNNNVYTKRLF